MTRGRGGSGDEVSVNRVNEVVTCERVRSNSGGYV